MASGIAHRPPPKVYDLDVTIVSAKHLKNVNWRNGDLKPYVILWVDPARRQATKPDDSGSTRPVWNERFVVPLTLPLRESTLTLEVFHSKPSETSKPLVGSLRFELRDLLCDTEDSATRLRSFELLRPSGRPHGKIRLKIGLIERPMENHSPAPASSYYYSSAPPPPMPYRGYSPSPYSTLPPPSSSYSPPPPPHQQPYYSYSEPHYYSDPHHYSSYYSQAPAPAPAPRPFLERQAQSNYGGSAASGPSAPVDYTPSDYHKRSVGKPGMGAGLAVGAAAGALGGLTLEEGIKYEEEKIAENDLASTASARDDRDRYGEYRRDY